MLAARVRKYNFINYLVIPTVCLFLLIMTACSSGRSRTRGSLPEGKTANEFISAMKTRLNLTEEQEIQVYPIIHKEFEKRREIFERHRGQGRQGMQSLKNEMKELQITTEKKLEKILMPEKMKEYRRLINEERQNMRKNMHHRIRHRF
jgi:hypothetical protein